MATGSQRLVALVWFIAIFSRALSAGALHVRMMAYPQKPEIYTEFQLILHVNERFDFSHRVYYEKKEFPENLELLGGPYIKQSENDRTDYVYTVKARKSGLFKLPTFYYTNGTIAKEVPPLSLEIVETGLAPIEVKGAYRHPPHCVYQGQSFGLVLEVQNLSQSMPIDAKNPFPVANSIVENAPSLGSIIEHAYSNRTLYQVPAMAWVVTTGQAPVLSLPAIKMQAGSENFLSSAINIPVLPLPPQVQKSGAVGTFTVTSEISTSEEIEETTLLQLKVHLEGEGNFPFLKLPTPVLSPHFEIIEEAENRVLQPSYKGYAGYIEQIYYIKATKTTQEQALISIPEFSFWDPEALLIQTTKATQYSMHIRSLAQNNESYPFLSAETIVLKNDFSYLKFFMMWTVLVPLVLGQYFAIRRRTEQKTIRFFVVCPFLIVFFVPCRTIPPMLRTAEQHILEENWAAAQQCFARAVSILPKHKAALMYNQAVAMQRQHKIGWACYYLTKALEYNPLDPMYQKAWQTHKKRYKLSSSIIWHSTAYFAHVYYLCVILSFLLTLHITTKQVKNSTWHKLVLTLVFAILMGANISLCYQTQSPKAWAVALENTKLRRIPETEASLLYEIKEGSILDITAQFDNFYLLNNAHEDLWGWATADKLMLGQE